MAIIACPFCGHKISDKSATCSKCNGNISALTPEKLSAMNRDKMMDKAQRLLNISMMGLFLFLAGFGLMYWWDPAPGSTQQLVAYSCVGFGFVLYIVSRLGLILLKKRK